MYYQVYNTCRSKIYDKTEWRLEKGKCTQADCQTRLKKLERVNEAQNKKKGNSENQ